MTEQIAEQVAAWYEANINPEELDKKIEATLEYVKRFNTPDENNEWNVWAYEIVDGHHGQYTVRIFLDKVLEEERWLTVEDIDELMEAFDNVSSVLADLFNAHTKLDGHFWVGHHEADGSLGVTYSVKA